MGRVASVARATQRLPGANNYSVQKRLDHHLAVLSINISEVPQKKKVFNKHYSTFYTCVLV